MNNAVPPHDMKYMQMHFLLNPSSMTFLSFPPDRALVYVLLYMYMYFQNVELYKHNPNC